MKPKNRLRASLLLKPMAEVRAISALATETSVRANPPVKPKREVRAKTTGYAMKWCRIRERDDDDDGEGESILGAI